MLFTGTMVLLHKNYVNLAKDHVNLDEHYLLYCQVSSFQRRGAVVQIGLVGRVDVAAGGLAQGVDTKPEEPKDMLYHLL